MPSTGRLAWMFKILQRYGMRLNRKKCVFRVQLGKFPGFMISSRGIEANPNKVKVVSDMRPPWNMKEVQWLNRCTVALGDFSCQNRHINANRSSVSFENANTSSGIRSG